MITNPNLQAVGVLGATKTIGINGADFPLANGVNVYTVANGAGGKINMLKTGLLEPGTTAYFLNTGATALPFQNNGVNISVALSIAPASGGFAGTGLAVFDGTDWQLFLPNVLGTSVAYSGINAAGTAAVRMTMLDGTGRLQILPDGVGDILWGKALVALGAGAPAVPGLTGGTGPATAAQNSWMRVVDNGGTPFWVPVWK